MKKDNKTRFWEYRKNGGILEYDQWVVTYGRSEAYKRRWYFILIILIISLILSKSSHGQRRFTPTQQRQATLLYYANQGGGKYILTMKDLFTNDTLTIQYGRHVGMGRQTLVIGDKYTIKYDTAYYKTVDSCKIIRCSIKRNS